MEKLIEEGIRIRSHNQGDYKTTCPKCSHTRKNKKDQCLSVTVKSDGGAVWKCHHCEWVGGTGGESYQKKEYKRPQAPKNSDPDSTRMVKWFESRGISKKTIADFNITRTVNFFNNGEEGCIAFPYYQKGELVNIKYRTSNKEFRQEKDAERSLFNMDRVVQFWEDNPQKNKRVIFVEGEMDVLSLYEVGFPHAVSLPDGAPKTAKFDPDDKRFQALKSAEWIDQADEIIIAVDNDEAGKSLQLELLHRFGKDRCSTVTFPDAFDIVTKDANEVLMTHGADALKYMIKSRTPCPVEGIYTATDYEAEVFNIYQGNIQKPVSTGFQNLDEIYKVMPSTFCLVTGVPNHGKSNFIDQIAINLAQNENWRFAIFSPEHSTANHLRRLSEKVTKKPFDIGITERMSVNELGTALAFLKDKFYFIESRDIIPNIDWLLAKMRVACLRHGVKGIIIDPYNEIDSTRQNTKREDEHIRDLISACKQFCRRHNVAMWMVAHPAKMQRNSEGVIPAPSLYDVSGSAHWNNMADVGLVIHRDFEQNETMVITRKVREQGLYGSIGQAHFRYSNTQRIYCEIANNADTDAA
jgi:twinkle protein